MIKFPINYKNGNYNVSILSDGTKIKQTDDDEFNPDRPETIDINLSNKCNNRCPFCYINATPNGKQGNLNHRIFDEIPEYSEIALNYCDHPDLIKLLLKMRDKNVIVNFTVNQIDFVRDFNILRELQINKLFYGLGISVPEINNKIYKKINRLVTLFDNVVIHTIAGVTDNKTFEYIHGFCDKLLILGYKTKGRGKFYIPNFNKLNIYNIFDMFDIVSFDNLALEQLEIQNIIDPKIWETHYMGNEGEFSFYIDTVDMKFYKSSMEEIGYDIDDHSLQDMFEMISVKSYINWCNKEDK